MQQYLALCKVVEVGSFSKAADILGYSQSGISQMVQSVEEEFEMKLLHRSRSGVKLTIEGQKLLPYIQALVNDFQAMRAKGAELKGLESGLIRIGTISSVSGYWLPAIIKEFQQLHPGVQFVLHQGDYDSIPEWTRIGERDFGFVNPAAVSGLKTQFLKKGNMLAVLPKDHWLAGQEAVSLQQLAQEPFLRVESGSYSEPQEAFRAAGLTPDIKLCIHDDYSILAMVEAGLGVSILAELMLKKIKGYAVCIRPIVPAVQRDIGVVYKDLGTMPIASRRFLTYLQEHVPGSEPGSPPSGGK